MNISSTNNPTPKKRRTLGERVADEIAAYTRQHGKLQKDTWKAVIARIVDDCANPKGNKPIYAEIRNAYPRKVGKDAAMKAIARACQKTDAEWILARTQRYAQCVSKWPRQYRFTESGRDLVPHPATWFNRGSYADDPHEWEMGSTGVKLEKVAESIPPEPKDWTDRFVEEFGHQGWEKVNAHTVRAAGVGERRWPDLGPLGLWKDFQ